VGGCSTSSIERRSRLTSTEVILQFNNNNNNQVSSEEDNDDNGNEAQLSVAEIRCRFDSSSPATANFQNDGRVRRHPVRSSPSPVLTRKLYNSKTEARLSSSEDEEDEEEGEEYKQQTKEGDIMSRRSPSGGVAGGATSSPSSVTREHTPTPESSKPSKFGYQSADAVSNVICVFVKRPRAGFVRFSRNCPVSVLVLIGIGLLLLPGSEDSISLLLLPASKSV
jgi:hypothetical protein